MGDTMIDADGSYSILGADLSRNLATNENKKKQILDVLIKFLENDKYSEDYYDAYIDVLKEGNVDRLEGCVFDIYFKEMLVEYINICSDVSSQIMAAYNRYSDQLIVGVSMESIIRDVTNESCTIKAIKKMVAKLISNIESINVIINRDEIYLYSIYDNN